MTAAAAMAPTDGTEDAHGARPKRLYGVAPLSCFMEHHVADDQSDSSITREVTAASGVGKLIGGGASGATAIGRSNVWSEYSVPQAYVFKALAAVDVVVPTDHKCNCFTKAYGKYVKGTGSFVANRAVVKSEWDGTVINADGGARGEAQNGHIAGGGDGHADRDGHVRVEQALGAEGGGIGATAGADAAATSGGVMLRYFTEREVANIHSFPPEFSFPAHITRGQRYALLGNSLSVACVAPLIDYLLTDA
mmetsp:Transcript_29066/g.46615  ORF Transcript_29066/g.46615 Transcript_29066/m.46615 type:complete len:250 (-) Transcript_29066:34-783(-)